EKAAKEYYDNVGPTLGGTFTGLGVEEHGLGGSYSAGGGVWGKPATSIPIIHGGRWLALDYALAYSGRGLWETRVWIEEPTGDEHEDTPAPRGYRESISTVRTYYGTRAPWLTLPVYALEGYAIDQRFFGCIPGTAGGCVGQYVASIQHVVRF